MLQVGTFFYFRTGGSDWATSDGLPMPVMKRLINRYGRNSRKLTYFNPWTKSDCFHWSGLCPGSNLVRFRFRILANVCSINRRQIMNQNCKSCSALSSLRIDMGGIHLICTLYHQIKSRQWDALCCISI